MTREGKFFGDSKDSGLDAMFALDLLIAATGLANDLPVYTCNPGDFEDLASLIDVVPIP